MPLLRFNLKGLRDRLSGCSFHNQIHFLLRLVEDRVTLLHKGRTLSNKPSAFLHRFPLSRSRTISSSLVMDLSKDTFTAILLRRSVVCRQLILYVVFGSDFFYLFSH